MNTDEHRWASTLESVVPMTAIRFKYHKSSVFICVYLWFIVALMGLSATANAADCTVHSDAQAHALVELYTSEGCSSCPPADRWLSELAAHGDRRIVPIAFHVS